MNALTITTILGEQFGKLSPEDFKKLAENICANKK
jgi:hypothetical protein